ncbi:hydroxymethylbilane synthase [Amphibiibacter pelophylacis]|uniref:Hydroxymethylbilane synthase n=1 Tax=Amphibiibacter pelophylacis TaxID=1799477 RepID=A0ACC6P2N9_9BURK
MVNDSTASLNDGGRTPGELRIATRESRLALWQAHHVSALLQERLGVQAPLLGMTTRGDQILDRSLSKVGGKGLFVKELERALLDGRADLAVHSLKDVPMDLPDGMALVAILKREDPLDAWVSPQFTRFADLPPGARVGTSSLRRVVQLLALRPDLQVLPVRGNLDRRLARLDAGEYDGLVLAAAGLMRLELGGRIRHRFTLDEMLPCAGQGALGLETVAGHAASHDLMALGDARTWLATQAERGVSRTLQGSCSIPLAAHAHWLDAAKEGSVPRLRLAAVLGHALEPQRPLIRASIEADLPPALLAQALSPDPVAARAALDWATDLAARVVADLRAAGDVPAYLDAAASLSAPSLAAPGA